MTCSKSFPWFLQLWRETCSVRAFATWRRGNVKRHGTKVACYGLRSSPGKISACLKFKFWSVQERVQTVFLFTIPNMYSNLTVLYIYKFVQIIHLCSFKALWRILRQGCQESCGGTWRCGCPKSSYARVLQVGKHVPCFPCFCVSGCYCFSKGTGRPGRAGRVVWNSSCRMMEALQWSVQE